MSTIGTMLGEIVNSLFNKPATEKYPFERLPAPVTLRGKLVWNPEKCTGCQLCIKDCPSEALELIVLDKVNKRFVLRYYIDRCTYCAQCLENCRFKCLGMSSEDWELASANKDSFIVYYGKDEDVQTILARFAQGPAETDRRE
jgi:formate hydrogenlyase subunit 6/NADH:ubiquinone oxidoreductase subunit I